jgi:hypothetical protein
MKREGEGPGSDVGWGVGVGLGASGPTSRRTLGRLGTLNRGSMGD